MVVKLTIEMFVVMLSHRGSSEFVEELLDSCGFNLKKKAKKHTDSPKILV